MQTVNPCILTINGGSSSIKFSVFEAGEALRWRLDGELSGIGSTEAGLRVHCDDPRYRRSHAVAVPNHAAAGDLLMQLIEEFGTLGRLEAAGHRIVHGGPSFSQPQRITPAMIEALQALSPFDPEHLPGELALLHRIQCALPDLPQVACFDTALHHTMPRVAHLLPIPRRYERQGLRRYGFHGLSYQFLLQALTRLGDPAAAEGRVILAHLGSGASLAAVRNGESIDTTMGFTPAAGVPMSTRSGDLDPGIAGYLARSEDMSAEGFNTMVNSESGLLGLSETSADLRELLQREPEDPRAAEAIAVFCYQIKKSIGAFTAALGGLDTLVFAGGIGEHAPIVRARICAGLACLGIHIEPAANAADAEVISTPGSAVTVRVIPTDEAHVIATAVCRVLALPCATTGQSAASGANPPR